MSDTEPVYQVRKVFDPTTMAMREELVQTGTVKVETPAAEEAPAPPEAEATEDAPKKVSKPKESVVAKAKKRRRKKKADA